VKEELGSTCHQHSVHAEGCRKPTRKLP